MANTATSNYNTNEGIYEVKVNGTVVAGRSNSSEATTIKDRLNKIFSDPNRDLDFIIPSYVNGQYVICCPLVRKNQGHKTYFYDTTSNATNNYYDEKLYEPTNWQDGSTAALQSAIMTIPSTVTAPWYDALVTANLIRKSITLNSADASGSTSCRQLIKPTNIKSTSTVVSNSVSGQVYGVPCQGTQAGTTSICPELGYPAQNILSAVCSNGEVFHPQDLVCALTLSNSWSSTYRNKFIKITNTSTNKSIVVRVVDTAPANKGVELSYRAWISIDKPSTVKFEVMDS